MSRPSSYFDRDVKLHTPEQMFARLAEIGRKIGKAGIPAEASVVSGLASQPTATADGGASTDASQASDRSSPRDRQPLEWLSPVSHPNTEKTQTSKCGRYAVFGRRSQTGFVFIARCGLESLGSFGTAQEARNCCENHHGPS